MFTASFKQVYTTYAVFSLIVFVTLQNKEVTVKNQHREDV